MKYLGQVERLLLPLGELFFLLLTELLLLLRKALWLPLQELLFLPLALLRLHLLPLQVVQRHLFLRLLALHRRHPTASPYRLQLRRQSRLLLR